jgi:hypothetical protein
MPALREGALSSYFLDTTLVVQDHAQEAAVNRQPPGEAFVIDKAQLLELIHEMTDPRPSRADHLRQVFLIDSGMYSFSSTFLPKMSQQQENPSQTLLAGVEKLIDEIPFESDVA